MNLHKNFIRDEVFTLSWSGAVGRSKTYKSKTSESIRFDIKNFVKYFINKEFLKDYRSKVDDNLHINNIELLSKEVGKKFFANLHNDRFRIGSSQKVLNLYLKYLWCLNDIVEPPHCPIDAIILNSLKKKCNLNKKKVFNISWTKLDSIDEYKNIISEARNIVGNNLSLWELNEWNNN